MRDEEVARQRDRISRGPQVVRDREYPFAEDLIADSSGTVDAGLPVLAKVSSLVEVLRLGGGELWTGASAVVPVYSCCQSSERGRHVVAGRGSG